MKNMENHTISMLELGIMLNPFDRPVRKSHCSMRSMNNKKVRVMMSFTCANIGLTTDQMNVQRFLVMNSFLDKYVHFHILLSLEV